MSTRMKWARRFSNSSNNFDLVLVNPAELDPDQMNALLSAISKETHRGLSLSSRASAEFRRWLANPETPLKSEAYVLLSNWFMTQSGDRHSTVATRCEVLWDALFPCRPLNRLSSSEPGRNHVIIPNEFQNFWERLVVAQGESPAECLSSPARFDIAASVQSSDSSEMKDGFASDILRAKVEGQGLRCEVEGSPRAVADFLRRMSGWNSGQA